MGDGVGDGVGYGVGDGVGLSERGCEEERGEFLFGSERAIEEGAKKGTVHFFFLLLYADSFDYRLYAYRVVLSLADSALFHPMLFVHEYTNCKGLSGPSGETLNHRREMKRCRN